ncbi:hypothetical protein BDR26DRAFT_24254 [Obelidium mucronatum]|nr:hypothetical protein BDR26DRAFT_24254 [Obelidium mucronatum]
MLSSSRDAVGVLRDLNDSLSQIDAVVLDLVRREENLNSWTSDVMGKVKNGSKGQKGLLVHSLQIAIDSGFNAFYGEYLQRLRGSLSKKCRRRGGVVFWGLSKHYSMQDFSTLPCLFVLCPESTWTRHQADTFIPILCRSASLSKTDLSNTASVERGTAALSIITSILFTCQDISSESFALPVKNLVKQFRVWFMAGNDVRLGDISAVLVAQVADFLSAVIERGAEFDINVASFVVELANTMILNAPTKTVLFRALAMYQAITSGDLETWAAMDKFHDSIQEVCLDLFISECSGENLLRASRPQSELQSRLAYHLW